MELSVAGHTTYLYTGGKTLAPGRPTVVFVHGAQLDHSCWSWQSRWFAHHGFNALAADLPGHGRSAGPLLPSIEALAEWLMALLDAAVLPRAALVGHSMGSLASLEAALRYPDRVSAIALIGTALPMPVSGALLGAAQDDENRAEALVNLWSHGPRGLLGRSPVPGLWLTGAARRLMARATTGVLYNDLAACNAYGTGPAQAAQIRCPSLIIAGRRDAMTPWKSAQALARQIPGARLTVVEGAGHSLMTEAPDEVLDALKTFIPIT